MSGRFRLTPGGNSPHQPWFHIGTLEVTTTWLVVLLSATTLIVNAFSGNLLFVGLALDPARVLDGWVWTLVTWPFAFPVQGILWSAIAIALFWYFGSDIERSRLGKTRFLSMLVIWTLIFGVLQTVLSLLLGRSEPLYDLGLIEMMVVLLWIGEWPTRRFLFNIPAWAFGLFLVGINLLQYVGQRRLVMLLTFVIGLALCAMVAKGFGMLSEISWIPRMGGGGPQRPKAARPAKQKRSKGKAKGGGPTVVSGPWSGSPPPSTSSRDVQRMDELLEKIHDHGTESLTKKERNELMSLRERLRRS